jgi:hypothetical protein
MPRLVPGSNAQVGQRGILKNGRPAVGHRVAEKNNSLHDP